MGWVAVLSVLLFAASGLAVKRGDFKRCDQSGFCVRQRAAGALRSGGETSANLGNYAVLPSTLRVGVATCGVSADVLDASSNALFALNVDLRNSGDALRVSLAEKSSSNNPFHVADAALISNGHDPVQSCSLEKIPNGFVLSFTNTNNKNNNNNNLRLVVQHAPFSFDIVDNQNKRILSFNDRTFLHYEHKREKTAQEVTLVDQELDAEGNVVEPSEVEKNRRKLLEDLKKDMWEESFNGKSDSKPRGPSSIGFDISFPGFSHVYGIPQHASSFALKPTRGENAAPGYSDPYRLYNFDVFEYELDNPMALYGSVPFMMAHRKGQSVGVLWVNAAEMWIDVEKRMEYAGSSKLKVQDASNRQPVPSTSTHWMAESGILDLLIFLGPTPHDVSRQYTSFAGRSILPQHFAIGYHQSRWNYLDEQDVLDVDEKFDEHDVPYDVLWLDIEHTNGKRYFTWDKVKFPDPVGMQEVLGVKGRKMVTIIDPHLKSDDGYTVAKQAKDLGILVKNKDNGDFDGWCWPGTSYWIDYLNPDGRKFWAEQFKFGTYEGSTKYLYTWNDMNEPSVFSGPEITMPKDNLHFGNVEHREVHNLYGALQHRATAEGHLLRSDNKDRPFVLSRAFFIGTQRYGAIWTGDNTAEWSHLEISIPMLLSISTAGVTFSGADVGGFFGNPDAELLVRWYQAAAWQPFFRAHAHIDTKRREPWLVGGSSSLGLIREAVRGRYKILPYLYTLFWEANQEGISVMRPLMAEFPNDEETFAIDNAFMLGNAILVHPVVKQGVTSVDVYLPTSAKWFDYDTFAPVSSGRIKVPTPLEKVPRFLRAGTILPRRDRVRRAANLSLRDPFTLIVAVDGASQSAKGTLYVDDGHSYEHQTRGAFIVSDFEYAGGVLSARVNRRTAGDTSSAAAIPPLTPQIVQELGSRVERLILVGFVGGSTGIKSVTVDDGKSAKRRLEFRVEGEVVVVKDPKVLVGEEWKIIIA